jgi:hypothetical protein
MRIVLALVAVLTVTTSRAQAAPLIVEISTAGAAAGEGGAYVGLTGLGGQSHGWGLTSEFHDFINWTFSSGPLVSVTPLDGGEATQYVYQDGILDVEVTWTKPDGSPGAGGFTAPLTDIVTTVHECVCAGDGPLTGDFFGLGPGRFTPELANLLGVRQETLGGSMMFFLEVISGDITSPVREGNFNVNAFDIRVYEAPEPTLAVLVMGGALAAMKRRRYPSKVSPAGCR